jgi:hypothetical protein
MLTDTPQRDTNRREHAVAQMPPPPFDTTHVGPRSHHPPRTRRAGQQSILSIRATINEGDTTSFLEESLDAIHAYMQERHIQPAGSPFAICRPTGEGTVDIEAGWPLERAVEGSGPIHCGSVPSALVGHDRPVDRMTATRVARRA